jgi:hypothetical protein
MMTLIRSTPGSCVCQSVGSPASGDVNHIGLEPDAQKEHGRKIFERMVFGMFLERLGLGAVIRIHGEAERPLRIDE